MVLFLEAAHDPALRERLARGRATMEATLLPALARLGASDPQLATDALAAASKGSSCTTSADMRGSTPGPCSELVIRAALV